MGLTPIWLLSLSEEIRAQAGNRRKTVRRHREKVVIYKPRRKASEETNPADSLIADSRAPDLWDNKSLGFKPPGPWQSWQMDRGTIEHEVPQDSQPFPFRWPFRWKLSTWPLVHMCGNLSREIPRNGIATLQGRHIFKFARCCQIAFQRVCICLYSRQ